MSQQINLFNPIFLKQQKHFSAKTMAEALGLILIGAILLSVYTNFQLSSLKKDAESASAQLKLAQAQLTKVTTEVATQQKSKSLEDDIHKTESEVASLQQVFNILKKGEFGNTKGYSEYWRAFSRQIVDGIWLTGISISGAGNEIGIDGKALSPELVPMYINRLRREPVMQGKSFATLEMQVPQVDAAGSDAAKQKVSAGYLDFSLQSAGLNEPSNLPGATK